MTWIVSLVVAILSAVVGLFVAGTVASFAVDWYRISSFEGGSGYFVVFMALFGGMAGFVIGLVASRVMVSRASKRSFAKELGLSVAIMLGLGLAVAGAARLTADVPPEIDGQTLFVHLELRWPDGQAPSAEMRSQKGVVTLGSLSGSVVRVREDGPLFTDHAFVADGHWVMPGEVRVFTERGSRVLLFEIGETRLPAFALPLSGRPGNKYREWSEWLPSTGDVSSAQGFRYRFKLRLENEPVRVDRVGPFAIETRARGYHEVTESDRFAAQSTFVVRHGDTPVAGLDDVEAVAVIGGSVPALLVKADTADRPGMCHLVREVSSAPQVTTIGECALTGSVSPLTADQARFDAARKSVVVSGWVDEQTFAQPGLYRISQIVLDTRTLTSWPFVYLSNYSPHGSVPPLSLSPDERSFIVLTSDYERDRPALVAIDYRSGKASPIAIDRARMRFNNEKDLGPAWIAHHYMWQPSESGERLAAREEFALLPHHGELTLAKAGAYQSYTLRPGGAPLREAIVRVLVERFGGERLPDSYSGYQQRVQLDGREFHVTVAERPWYVNVSMDGATSDPAIMERVAKRLDAILATGELDEFFVEPEPSRK